MIHSLNGELEYSALRLHVFINQPAAWHHLCLCATNLCSASIHTQDSEDFRWKVCHMAV